MSNCEEDNIGDQQKEVANQEEERKSEQEREEAANFELMIQQRENHNAKLIKASKDVPEQLIEKSKQHLDSFKSFQEEIEADVNELEKRQVEIKQKFYGKINDKDNSDGFLTHTIEKYHQCFGPIDKQQLSELM